MATLTSNQLTLPKQYIDVVESTVRDTSVLAALAPRQNVKFGPVSAQWFDDTPLPAIVGELEDKPSTTATFKDYTVEQVKFVLQVRESSEFKWGDDDYRLGRMDDIAQSFGRGMAAGFDLFAMYGVNPSTGAATDKAKNFLAQTTNTVTASSSAVDTLLAAGKLVLASGARPTAAAVTPAFTSELATDTYADGRDKLPNINLGSMDAGLVKGIRTFTSEWVDGNGRLAAGVDTYEGFVGDFNRIYYGTSHEFPMELIEYGNPDGQGDLKRTNAVLLRTEVVGYVMIPKVAAFAKIKKA